MKNEYLNCKNDLYAKINSYKNDNNIKKLELTTKDPHIQELIESVSLVQGALRYEVENLGNSLYETLLINIGLTTFLPSKIISSCTTNIHCFIQKNTLLIANGNYWRTTEDFFVSNYSLKTKEIVHHEDQIFLNLVLSVIDNKSSEPIILSNTIDFLLDEYLINSIFFEDINILAKIWNRDCYFTECSCEWIINNYSIDDYDHFPEQFHRIRIKNIDTRAITNEFVLSIPLKTQKFITTNNIIINPIIIENLYNYNLSLDVQNQGDYQLDLNNQILVNINKITINNELEIENLMHNSDGWYILPNNSVHFQCGYKQLLQINCLVADQFIEFFNYPIFFQEYNDVSISSIIYHVKYKYLYESNHIKYIIQKLKQYNLIDFFNFFIKTYNLNIVIVNITEKIIPIINNSYVVNTIFTELHCQSSESIIKLFILYKSLREKFNIELYVNNNMGCFNFKE